jgi:hypothetical protein
MFVDVGLAPGRSDRTLVEVVNHIASLAFAVFLAGVFVVEGIKVREGNRAK